MMHTRNCTNAHKYLNDDRFDTVGLEAKIVETFGAETVEWTKKQLEAHFGEYPKDLRQYFNLLDAKIAEMYHLGDMETIGTFSKIECFILANNFYGPD